MRYLLAILTFLTVNAVFATRPCIKCDLEKVRIVNQHLDSLTDQMVGEFLCTFNNSCITNVEYSELSNETLFAVLDKAPTLFFQVLTNGQIDDRFILSEIENPVNDVINLQAVYDRIRFSEANTELKTKYLNALLSAAEKRGQALRK